MSAKTIGVAVVTAALVTFPLTACGSGTPTTRVTVTATPTTTLSLAPCPPVNDPAWESCLNSHREQQERDADRQKQAATAAAKPAPQGHGVPWWCWVLGTIIGIGLLLWWGTTLDDGSSARTARDDDGDDDDGDRDDDEGEYPVLSYPAIPTPTAPEPTSVPVQPAPSGSLMDRLGK
ncbi:hypothetical protein [Mycobacteroides abscessus]|uniref:hypothetical protein n=1 Tax=Mycobacteroides abscessus TaxID=36809 RepID=UPI0009264D0E|nr:hypothetical protein [Mycobacteroides abscessus]SHT49155.1 Uncharacterised protein [Mycobacteroides abscessus subsp. abscessus]SHT53709.1 Uncharacterised protein [Mycobacteroides abscessus subsp. abscessus]SKK64064.1 Uncharacterised protein [Mycobacteroides abscessus subsp. abscessus]